ncbi:hypothetical protein T4D_3728 [Trichinella pseudospiralis]|uniref:Uncharacterized protein n=1 Tax=Trichinella pseudospiralis TaxID=6337 RepID=A0A0V1FY85_TRIPS|nr:hypothetical protein T4D_3728 [Trichinella pseudospiralis]
MLIFAFSPSKSSNFNRSKSITNDACFIRLIFKQANKQQQQQQLRIWQKRICDAEHHSTVTNRMISKFHYTFVNFSLLELC